MFDYDGTLTPIVDHPSGARLTPETRQLLHELSRNPRVELGILSGRCLDDLKDCLGLDGLFLAGTSGLELEWNGRRWQAPHATHGRILMENLTPGIQTIADRYPGAWVENKGLAITVHYRQLCPSLAAALQCELREVLHRWRECLRAVPGPMALEIGPTLGWDKGTAVRTMMRPAPVRALPLFAGDSENDREAMQAALDLGGIAIGIGEQAPEIAPVRLPEPETLLALLRQLKNELIASLNINADDVAAAIRRLSFASNSWCPIHHE